jgi:hypothetical protein
MHSLATHLVHPFLKRLCPIGHQMRIAHAPIIAPLPQSAWAYCAAGFDRPPVTLLSPSGVIAGALFVGLCALAPATATTTATSTAQYAPHANHLLTTSCNRARRCEGHHSKSRRRRCRSQTPEPAPARPPIPALRALVDRPRLH